MSYSNLSITLSEYWNNYDRVREILPNFAGYGPYDPKYTITPYKTLEEAISYLRANYRNTMEVKFIAPDNLNEWEHKIKNCTIMCKILRTIHQSIPERLNDFSFEYRSKSFWKETSFAIQYDASNYRINIETGLKFKQGDICLNKQTGAYEQAQEFLGRLLNVMTNTSPTNHSQKVWEFFSGIK